MATIRQDMRKHTPKPRRCAAQCPPVGSPPPFFPFLLFPESPRPIYTLQRFAYSSSTQKLSKRKTRGAKSPHIRRAVPALPASPLKKEEPRAPKYGARPLFYPRALQREEESRAQHTACHCRSRR